MASSYREQIYQTLPRLLALYDYEQASTSYGVGDRFHWAWGLIDFGNGTFQGAANGLARLLANHLLPEGYSETAIMNRINAMYHGAEHLSRKDGSMEEAFPYEGSFCVTALVAYDLLTALELISCRLDNNTRKRYLSVVRPMIAFLHAAEETHAFISNHLATAVGALYKWHKLTGENSENRAAEILGRILAEQSEEGWYREYEGADPGYQSLCTYYLADVLRMTNNTKLRESLECSLRFLWHFIHPDGSFGGIYGSRNTRFYYPAGIECLADQIPEAASLARFMRESIKRQTVVTLTSMDEANLIPMFNSYCWAATLEKEIFGTSEIPCRDPIPFRRYWPASGLLVDRGEKHYTIIAGRKGGIVYHYCDGKSPCIDSGLLFKSENGNLFSTQVLAKKNAIVLKDDKMIIQSEIKPVTKQLPKPWQFVILRFLNITIMRFRYPRELIKKMLVRILITGSRRSFGHNHRMIQLGHNLKIVDQPSPAAGLRQIPATGLFSAIHMASQGYWQAQDET